MKLTLQTVHRIFLLVSMGGRAEGLVCADPEARTPMAPAEIVQAVSTLMVWAKFAFGPKSQRKSWPEKINVVL